MLRQFLWNPAAFMDRKSGEPGIRTEILLVLVLGGFGALGPAYVGFSLLDASGGERLQLPVAGLILTPVIGMGVVWIAYTLGLHLIVNRILRHRGPLFRLMKPTAWALVPLGVGNLVNSGIMYFVFQDMEYLDVIEGANTAGFASAVGIVIDEGKEEPAFLLVPIVTLLSIAACGYFLIHAVEQGKDISRSDARTAAIAVVGIHGLYVLWNATDVLTNFV